MKTLRLVAATALVSSVFALSASAAESEWWDVTFESASFQANFPGLTIGELGTLTNDEQNMAAGTVQPYASGVWSAVDSDESYVTNEYNTITTNGYTFGSDNCLRLDTQGNDLTWTPTNGQTGVQTLVDADLYLVGSDSAPTDFDANHDVQAAIYLKNQTDDESQETTNSILCVYVYDEQALDNVWFELEGEGVTLTDNSWAHIQVKVDHSGNNPMVSVMVNETPMHKVGDASSTSWLAANYADVAPKITSVAFRGTGAVDNFVGKTVVEEELTLDFTAEVYIAGTLQTADNTGNTTRLMPDETAGTATSSTTFSGFSIDNWEDAGGATYRLDHIVICNPDGTEAVTFTYTYTPTNGMSGQVVADADDSDYVTFDPDFFDDTLQGGPFSVTVPTSAAVQADDGNVIAKIYFVNINEQPSELTPVGPGQSLDPVADADVIPAGVVSETDDGTGVTTDYFVVNFRAPEAGVTYTLMVSTDLTLTEEQWKGVGTGAATAATGDGTATSSAVGELITLKVPISGNAAFFKIKASK